MRKLNWKSISQKEWHSRISFLKKVSEVKIRSWLKIERIQNGELFLVDFGLQKMLTVQQAAGTQFHSPLSVHSVLIQGELYPIMTKKNYKLSSLFYWQNIKGKCLFKSSQYLSTDH